MLSSSTTAARMAQPSAHSFATRFVSYTGDHGREEEEKVNGAGGLTAEAGALR